MEARATEPPAARDEESSRARGDEPSADRSRAPFASRAAREELPNVPEPGDLADRAAQSESMGVVPTASEARGSRWSTHSESMASEPSEADIRLRAYHRYLERGGGHGAHFDDWLEAERELRRRDEGDGQG